MVTGAARPWTHQALSQSLGSQLGTGLLPLGQRLVLQTQVVLGGGGRSGGGVVGG